ncbi:MAG: hypothetical protein K2X29_14880 [Candidatus Obscuribacterales bacterium]|nr:hypothetical protein [Candidatus Obscuribacterales bacterium]
MTEKDRLSNALVNIAMATIDAHGFPTGNDVKTIVAEIIQPGAQRLLEDLEQRRYKVADFEEEKRQAITNAAANIIISVNMYADAKKPTDKVSKALIEGVIHNRLKIVDPDGTRFKSMYPYNRTPTQGQNW